MLASGMLWQLDGVKGSIIDGMNRLVGKVSNRRMMSSVLCCRLRQTIVKEKRSKVIFVQLASRILS